MINKGIDKGVAHCPIGEGHPYGVVQEKDHAGEEMEEKSQKVDANATQNEGGYALFFTGEFSEKSHRADAGKRQQIIQNEGTRCEDIGRFDEV